MPSDLSYRFRFIKAKYKAEYIWRKWAHIPITGHVRKCLQIIYKYINSVEPLEKLIGYIVPRVPVLTSTSDASTKAIRADIPHLKIWCLLPFSKKLYTQIKNEEIHISSLKFIALLISCIMVQEKHCNNPSTFPLAPVMRVLGDNTTANAWWQKMSTQSQMGHNLLKLYAEHQLLSSGITFLAHDPGPQLDTMNTSRTTIKLDEYICIISTYAIPCPPHILTIQFPSQTKSPTQTNTTTMAATAYNIIDMIMGLTPRHRETITMPIYNTIPKAQRPAITDDITALHDNPATTTATTTTPSSLKPKATTIPSPATPIIPASAPYPHLS